MVSNAGAPPRGSAAAAASLRRRRTGSAGGGGATGGVNRMLQFYTDDNSSRKISTNVVLGMSIGFIFVIALLHGIGKLYHGRSQMGVVTNSLLLLHFFSMVLYDTITGIFSFPNWTNRIQKLLHSRNTPILRFNNTLKKVHVKEKTSPDNSVPGIKMEELKSIMEKLGMCLDGREEEQMEERMDVDELTAMFEEEPRLDEVEEAFSVFDKNSDGFIDAEDLQRVLSDLGFVEEEESPSVEGCGRMIAAYDENMDGKIDLHEFFKLMEESFGH